MKTQTMPNPTPKPPAAKTYTAQDLAQHRVPSGVYKSLSAGRCGYWVTSGTVLMHFNDEDNQINTVGEPTTGDAYIQIKDAQIIFDIVLP